MLSYLANKRPHKRFPQPAIALLRHPHLQPHDLRHRHCPPWHGPTPRTPLRHRRRRCGHHNPLRQGASQHPQPKSSLHPTHLRWHRRTRSVTVMLRIKCYSAPATKSRRRPACGEEDFISCFPYVIMVQIFKLVKRPCKVAVLVIET